MKVTSFEAEGDCLRLTIEREPGEHARVKIDGLELLVEAWKREPVIIETTALGGRVAALAHAVKTVSEGRVVRQADGTSTLMLHGTTSPQVITAVLDNGDLLKVNVEQMLSKHGWAPRDVYMLRRDKRTGRIILRPGRGHRVFHITTPERALTVEAIAAHAKVAPKAVTAKWLVDRPEYGSTPDKALPWSLVDKIIAALPATHKVQPSPYMLFECGQVFEGVDIGIRHGESAVHPRYVGSYGDGHPPLGVRWGGMKAGYSQNTVIEGVPVHFGARNVENALFADVTYHAAGKGYAISHSGESSRGVTFYRPGVYDATKAAPQDGKAWDDSTDRVSGIYMSGTKGVQIIGGNLGFNGHGRNPSKDRKLPGGQNASALSHNVYFQSDLFDVAIMFTLSMDAASTSWQFRHGGLLKDNLSINDGIAGQNAGARHGDGGTAIGNYGLNIRQGAISSHFITYDRQRPGANNWGFAFGGPLQSAWDCFAMNAVDPADAALMEERKNKRSFDLQDPEKMLFENMVSFNWSKTNRNIDGLDVEKLKALTIERYMAKRLGKPNATKDDLRELLRSQTPQERQDELFAIQKMVYDVIAPKLALPFGRRTKPDRFTFIPSQYTDGFSYDIELNWDKRDVPGLYTDGDTVDLHGNTVKFINETVSLASAAFKDGLLQVSSGALEIRENEDSPRVMVMNCGEYVAPAGDGDYFAHDESTLFFTGDARTSITASGRAEVCLARSHVIPADREAWIIGNQGWFGWDLLGGVARLHVLGDLGFEVTPVLQFAGYEANPWRLTMRDFIGQESGFTGTPDSWRRNGTKECLVRVRGAQGLPKDGEMIHPPAVGIAEKWGHVGRLAGAEIGAIGNFRSGRFGMENPGCRSEVILSRRVPIKGKQYLAPGEYYLSEPGITVISDGATLEDGVTITRENRLLLTV